MDEDLEENIFKRNIPGKYHKWDREDDENGHIEDAFSDNLSEEDDNEETAFELNVNDPMNRQMNSVTTEKLLQDESIPNEIKLSILHERSQKHNTGVKSVLADRNAHKALEKAMREAKQRERDNILNRIANGAVVTHDHNIASEFIKVKNVEGSDDEDLDDGEDDEFMAEFRAKRLAQLKSAVELPSFGTMREVSNEDLVEELETIDQRVFIVVHLYEPGITSCVRMNRILEEIVHATNMIHVKFLRIACSRNGLEIDRVAFPMISIYRAGNLENTYAGDADFGGEYFKKDDVEWLLDSHIRG